jgi:hypothetical protein
VELPGANGANGHAPDADVGFDRPPDGQLSLLFRDVMFLGGQLGFPPLIVNGQTYRGRSGWDKLKDLPALLPRALERVEQMKRN